jgi:hypothetical protein
MLGGMENKAITFSPGKNLRERTWRAENATIWCGAKEPTPTGQNEEMHRGMQKLRSRRPSFSQAATCVASK